MSDHLIVELDVNTLRRAIREEYAEVAANPEKGFHFPTGRPLAQMLEYADEWPERVFSGAPQAGSAANFGTLGINFRARKAAGEEELTTALAALSCEMLADRSSRSTSHTGGVGE